MWLGFVYLVCCAVVYVEPLVMKQTLDVPRAVELGILRRPLARASCVILVFIDVNLLHIFGGSELEDLI